MKPAKILVASAFALVLVACGGGGGSSSGSSSGNNTTSTSSPTDNTTVDVGSGSVVASSNGNQLRDNITLTGFSAVGLANQSQQIASINHFFKNLFRGAISSAYAAGNGTCGGSIKKLTGIKSNGDKTKLDATEVDSSDYGFCEMVDAGNFIITTTSGIYKNGKTCNLVIIRKDDGKLFCFGEDVPAAYSLASYNGVNDTLQISKNGLYAYLTVNSSIGAEDAVRIASYRQSVKLIRMDLSARTPKVNTIADYDSSGFTAILAYKALNNGNLVIGRMEESTSPFALSDGKLRLVEYWTLTESNGVIDKRVAPVDYLFHANRNFNVNCFLNYASNDDDALLAHADVSGTYRSTLWRIPKPSSPTSSITPVKLTADGASRICWSNYPTYVGAKIFSIWEGWNGSQNTGNVQLIETLMDGTESVVGTLYNSGSTQGAWSSTYGRIHSTQDFLVYAAMNGGSLQNDSLFAIPYSNSYVTTPIVPVTIFQQTGRTITNISTTTLSNNVVVTSEDPASGGYRYIHNCTHQGGGYSCTQISQVQKTSIYGTLTAYGLN